MNSLPHNPKFKRPCVKQLLKTSREKEKMLQSYQREKIIILSVFVLLSANAFNLDQYKILSICKDLILFQTNMSFNIKRKKDFEDIVEKGKISCFFLHQSIFYSFKDKSKK